MAFFLADISGVLTVWTGILHFHIIHRITCFFQDLFFFCPQGGQFLTEYLQSIRFFVKKSFRLADAAGRHSFLNLSDPRKLFVDLVGPGALPAVIFILSAVISPHDGIVLTVGQCHGISPPFSDSVLAFQELFLQLVEIIITLLEISETGGAGLGCRCSACCFFLMFLIQRQYIVHIMYLLI